MNSQQSLRPTGVSMLAIVLFLFSLFAFFGSLFMWGDGFLLSFPPGVDYHFPVTDILVNAPASLLAAMGLWKMKQWGYVAAQFVAGFYIYASVEIFVMAIEQGTPFPIEIVIPQVAAVLVAIFLVFYLWRIRLRFV
ncbi:hypothetical protein TFLX_05464 [Thermoflexales bacterium]|nr:hypothetical protein TFLX_05464 [Thermoflexales bacterium]